ncbi:MAG TPA: 4Fe-4S dicluster domain-containing protein [Syntrophobacteraceae bacterium]|nr:4Fe-4S dicluster domain-containing protein [Syntrophobacteraceae bacterium]
MSGTKEIFIRIDRCVGCHTCEVACAVEHSASRQLLAAISEPVKPRKRLHVEAALSRSVPVLCRHCENAPCVAVCPTGATYRDDKGQLVLQEHLKCIGCMLCVQACPFGMMGHRAESRITLKCDRCPERQRPACVDACPTKALEYADSDLHAKSKRRAVVEALVSSYLPG